jgi:Tfp pilus assembly protein PilF
MPLIQGNPEMLDQGLQLTEILARTHPNDALSMAIYGDFLAMSDRFEDARKQYLSSIALDESNLTVWQQLMICESELNDMDGILNTSKKALELFPEQAVFYLYNGTANSLKKNYRDAVKTLLAGSKLVVDNDYLQNQFYIRLADAYHNLKDHELSDSYFEKSLKLDPDNPLVLNNYSYYLSLRKEKLDKAEVMSKRSNELWPDQPS